MSFLRDLEFRTEGIAVRAPLKCRDLGGIIADLWTAEGQSGAGGYYLSPNPRIVIFFGDVGQSIRVANEKAGLDRDPRPMGRAIYVPAGVPMWSRFTSAHQFRHLDLYLDQRLLQNMLIPRLGSSAALTALRTPVELDRAERIEALATLVADEVSSPTHHAFYLESLVQSIVGGMLALSEDASAQNRLSEAQMQRLRAHVLQHIHRRVGNAELAAEAHLSESWFAHLFKQTTGQTPQQWQSALRVERARALLAETTDGLSDVAHVLGFADQAHLTRVFRTTTGVTPGAWRRLHGLR